MFFVASKSHRLTLLNQNDNKLSVQAAVNKIPLRDNYFYLRNWAVSAFEKYGLNSNADGFLDEELQKAYPTFDQSWVCLNHKADCERDSIGENFAPVYTPEKYVELLMGIDRNRAAMKRPYLEDDVKNGRVTDTSMGCFSEYCICTACGNIASNEAEYCDHLANKMGQTIYLGNKRIRIGRLHFGVEFVENSIIDDGQGADMNAKIFEVAASKQGSKEVSSKDAVYYAVKQLEREYGSNLSIFKKINAALEKK